MEEYGDNKLYLSADVDPTNLLSVNQSTTLARYQLVDTVEAELKSHLIITETETVND